MSVRELARVEVMARVEAATLTLGEAAARLGLSYRHTKRLWRRYRAAGAAALQHGSVGRVSNRATPVATRRRVLRVVRAKYSGPVGVRFGPTLAAEHLAEEDGLVVHPETLRRWLLAEGLWARARRTAPHRQRRERKAHFGELVQLDGSFHAWFEDRGPGGCLMDLVDDATGESAGYFCAEETTWAAVAVLRQWIERYGVPRALYTDWKNVYLREPTEAERAAGHVPLTQFGRMCARVGIQIIGASSPQAKGRVERHHGTHQDRLVKKLRRQGVASYPAANAYLEAVYFPQHNARFARPPAAAADFHLPVPAGVALDEVFRLETVRTLSNDWVVRHANRFFQVQRQSRYAPARSKVVVCQYPDGRVALHYRGRPVPFAEIAPPPARPVRPAPAPVPPLGHRPAEDHPWRQSFQKLPDTRIWQAVER